METLRLLQIIQPYGDKQGLKHNWKSNQEYSQLLDLGLETEDVNINGGNDDDGFSYLAEPGFHPFPPTKLPLLPDHWTLYLPAAPLV